MSTEITSMRWVTLRMINAKVATEGWSAEAIVAWVNANGGEARYEPPSAGEPCFPGDGLPRIALRTINGWAYAAPGHYVVMGEATFDAAEHTAEQFVEAHLSHLMPPKVEVREFRVESPS